MCPVDVPSEVEGSVEVVFVDVLERSRVVLCVPSMSRVRSRVVSCCFRRCPREVEGCVV